MTFQRVFVNFLLILISSQPAFSQQYHAYQIPDGMAVPVLDGVLSDSVWSLATEDSCLFGDSGAWGTPWVWHTNNLVTWRAVWSATTNQLYVAVEVRDDIRSTFDNNDSSVRNFRPWNDDSIEFYTDGDLSRGDYVGRFDIAQQWRVTGENRRILNNYPVYNAVDFYTGDDFLTTILPGEKGNWVCEAVFNIYNNYPDDRKTIAPGDTIGWEIRYSDSDDKTWRDGCFVTDYFVGWLYSGPAVNSADYFGKLIFEPTPVEKSIEITNPTINSVWFLEDDGLITWTSNGPITAVTIEISHNDGSSWTTITDSTENDGEFRWEISGPMSANCRIKISELENRAVFSISERFSIAEKPSLQITSPQAGVHWYIGYGNKITWNSQGAIDSVLLALSRNNGQTWETLTTLPNTDKAFYWTVTGPSSVECQIKISVPRDSLIFSKSEPFAIMEIPGLRITSPGTSTTWYVGSQQTISWTSQGEIDSVRLKLTRDNGNAWEVIGLLPNSAGDFNWPVTEPASANCKISIEDLHNPEVGDTTEFFIIIAASQILVSEPATILYRYSQVQFIWQTFGPIERVNIELSRNGGQNWEMLAAQISNIGYFDWEVSGELSTQCLLRVSNADHTPTPGMSTIFTIKNPSLILQSPIGGEIWEIDAQKQINWQTEGTISQVKIELTRDNENTWEVLTESGLNLGKFDWEVAGVVSDHCKIKISDAHHSEISTKSADTFSINETPFIQIQNPLGNETWQINSAQIIRWHSNSRVVSVIIKLSRDNQITWTTLAQDHENSGTFDWTVTSPEARESCFIRILNSRDTSLYSENQWPFSIESAPVSPQLELKAPASNLSIEIGETVPIQWQVTGTISFVKIELSRNGGKNWQELTTTRASNQTYNWQSQPPVTRQCLLRISDPASSAIAISDTLTLVPQFIQELVNPNSQPSGSSQNGYRLVSIPIEAQYPRADSVLLDDLGEYNKINWRLFDLRDAEYHEYPAVADFIPGKSMFLIVRDAYQVIDAGPGYAVMDATFSIPLERGWNLVANPYETRVSGLLTVDHLELSHSQEPITLYSYEGAWGISRDFKPWTGYALKTTAPDTLKINPGWNYSYYKPQPKLKPVDWQVQIIASCQDAVDSLNYFGVASDASLTRDAYDRYEPPPIGDYVQVFFPHRDWPNCPDDYTIDFQKPDPNGNSWEFVVSSNIPDAGIDLTFEGISAIEGSQQVVLLDLAARTRKELNQKSNSVRFQLREATCKSYKLLVGSAEFMNRETQEFTAPPGNFEVYPNFPNPFNARTEIRFFVPEKSEIEAKVFNLLGESVGLLIPKKDFEAGFYQIGWEAKNDAGQELASGIYLLSFKNNKGEALLQKLLLVK